VAPDLLGLGGESGLRGVAFAALLAAGLGAAPLAATLLLGVVAVYGRGVRAGDEVEVGPTSGTVVEVTLRELRLEDGAGAEVRVPHLLTLVHPVRLRRREGRG
jgi:small-conductance mechanosensitive channel